MDGEGGGRTPLYSLMEQRSDSPWDWSGPARVLMATDVDAGEVWRFPGRRVITPDDRLMVSLRTHAGYRLVEADLTFDSPGRPPLARVIPGPFEPWEAGMTCFGAPCLIGPNELLFYNGDGYGRTGMGLAWRPRN